MEEKKQIKVSFNKVFIVFIIILIMILGTIFFIYNKQVTPQSNITSNTGSTSTTTIYSDTKKDIPTNSNTEYEVLWSTYSEIGNSENLFVTSNDELKTYLSKCFDISSPDSSTNTQNQPQTNSLDNIIVNEQPVLTYFDDNFFENNNLAIQMYKVSSSHDYYSIISVTQENSTATVNIQDDYSTNDASIAAHTNLNFIILDKNINKVNYDIYKTTTLNTYEVNFVMFFITAIVITIIIIAIVLMLNKKINAEIEFSAKRPTKKILFAVIIVILTLLLIFFSITSFKYLI